MAKRVIWTQAAWHDLDEAADFIAQDSPYYAAAFVREIKLAAQTLQRFSHRGRIVPELNNSNIREILIGSYRLIYHVADAVGILALIHSSRNLPALWEREGRS